MPISCHIAAPQIASFSGFQFSATPLPPPQPPLKIPETRPTAAPATDPRWAITAPPGSRRSVGMAAPLPGPRAGLLGPLFGARFLGDGGAFPKLTGCPQNFSFTSFSGFPEIQFMPHLPPPVAREKVGKGDATLCFGKGDATLCFSRSL